MKCFRKILFLFALISTAVSCNLAVSAIQKKINGGDDKKDRVYFSSLYWDKQTLAVKVGDLTALQLSAEPKNLRGTAELTYAYNTELIKVISDSRGVMVEGVKQGKTLLTAASGNITSNCSITVEGYAEDYEREPYIYTTSSNNIIQLKPGTSERVVVSLYGGKVEDNQSFTWISEKPNIAEVLGNGQFCVINGKAEGNTKITVRHPKAAYDFTFLVYVLQDAQNISYITTKTNVLTLKSGEGEKEISVAMQNAPIGLNTSLYEWSLDTDNGNPVCSIDANAEKAVVTPIRAGTAKIRVSHPSASYPLEILVRVVNIVENVYIKASETNVTLIDSTPQTVSVELVGFKGVYDKNSFVFEIPQTEVFTVINYSNQISLTGQKNGTEKITVTHPAAKYPLEIIVTATKQSSDAVDVSKYITTSKNYIRTKIGAKPTTLDIIFSGGSSGDRRNFKWSIAHSGKETGQKVIDFKTTDGEVTNTFRAISNKIETGSGIITPIAEGTATITITNSKALYPTEVIVEVLPEYAIIGSEWWFTGENIVSLLNGTEKDFSVSLNGSGVKESDYAKVTWETNSPTLTLIANELTAKIQATGNQKAISYIYVKHPRVMEPKKIIVLQADTQEELDAMKVLVAESERLVIHEKETGNLMVTAVGFTHDETQSITWESLNKDIATIELSKYTDPNTNEITENTTYPIVRGVKPGVTKIICHSNIANVPDLTFNVIVVPEGVDIQYDENAIYLTTSENVINIATAGETATVNVDMKGIISNYEKQNIQWENKNPEVVTITPNGKTCSITAAKEGEAVLRVTHEKSKNSLNIFVYVGNKLQYKKDDTVFINTDKSVIAVVKGTKAIPLKATLENSNTKTGFRFAIDDNTIAKLDYSSSDTYYVTPCEAGQASITVSHDESKFDKKVLVVVANTQEELEGFKYLSTGNNVVTVVEGSQANISVTVMNSPETILDGFHWSSEDRAIVDIVADTGSVANIVGNTVGTTKLTVTNDKCIYPLEIIVKCVSAAFAASQPYIATPTSVLVLKAGQNVDWKQVTATLEGGTKLDQQNFAWAVDNPSLVTAFGEGDKCNLKAMKAGTTRLQITHPKAQYPCYILLICENMQDTKYMIALKNVSNIISMKPTDNEMSIIVNLINGEAEDKYGFQWSLDNWDILEMTANGNEARIKPLMEGQATIRISHPKANNDEAVVVKVQEYTNFGFGLDFVRTVEGGDYMIPLQIPVSNIKTRIECETQNSKVCTITNTGKIALISGVGVGQTTVKAKLVAVTSNTVLDEAEMMVVVAKAEDQLVYITTNKTVYVLEQNMTRDLAVDLQGEGIIPTDKYNLQWKSSDPKVVKLLGASTTGIATGDMVKIQAVGQGDAVITVSHEKCNTNLTIKVNVPASADMDISLNKTAMRIEKGGSNAQFELKANLKNAEYSDYKTIVWTADRVENDDIVKILGSGGTVMVYPVKIGKTTVRAALPNGKEATCDVEVVHNRQFVFKTTAVTILPGETKTVDYIFQPRDGRLIFQSDIDDFFTYVEDRDTQQITITGKKPGKGKILGASESGNATLSVVVDWGYSFSLDKYLIDEDPSNYNPDHFIINYSVTPNDAEITANLIGSSEKIIDVVKIDTVKKKIILKPLNKEGTCQLEVNAVNKKDHNKNIALLARNNIINIRLRAKEITFTPQILNSNGNYSRIDPVDNTLIISDGEKVRFKVNPNVYLGNIKVEFEKYDSKTQELIEIGYDQNQSVNTITHTYDYFENFYVLKNKYHTYYRDSNNRFGKGKDKNFEVTKLEKINHATGAYYNIYMNDLDSPNQKFNIVVDKDYPFGSRPFDDSGININREFYFLKRQAYNNFESHQEGDGDHGVRLLPGYDTPISKTFGSSSGKPIDNAYEVTKLWCEKGETLAEPIYFTMGALKNSVFYTCEIKQTFRTVIGKRLTARPTNITKRDDRYNGKIKGWYYVCDVSTDVSNIYSPEHVGYDEHFLIPKTDFEEVRFDGKPTEKELIGYLKITYLRDGKGQDPVRLPVYIEIRYNCKKDSNYSWTGTLSPYIVERDTIKF